MKKIAILVLIISCLYGCDSTEENNTDSYNTLIGTWKHTYSNLCEETHTFSSSNNWRVTALNEISIGTFTFSENETDTKHSMLITVTYDNGLSDCNGNSSLDLGSVLIYVKFPSSSIMEWYIDINSTTPNFTLEKI